MSEEHTLPKLLAIDDSELIHRLLRVRLHGERVELHMASNPKDGLRMAKQLKPEVILLDIDMDELDGFEVLQRLKADPETQDISVIFISASNDTTDRVKGLDLGAVDFITKPFEVVELKARVRSALRVQALMKMLQQKAKIDGLTGLWNRNYFDGRLQGEVAEAIRHRRPLALVMCDIDRFKDINDHNGHPFGDTVIERVAHILSSGRTSDIACRYGGEEFGVILPTTTAEEARDVADRYRTSMSQARWSEHPGFSMTASFGVCDLERLPGVPSAEALVQAADAALYAAKQAGRNRVEVTPLPRALAR